MALNVHVTKKTPAFMLKMPAYQRARQRMLALGQEIVAEHRATSRTKPDLVDDLLAGSQQEQYQDLLGKEEQIAYAALGPFVAGLDTVANECTFMLYELFRHPAVLEQCIAEADELFAQGYPQLAQLKTQGVLYRSMQETLRLHSIAPVITRNAAKTFEFAGYRVEQGQMVIIATTSAHFLAENFAEPQKFDITRYSEPRREHKKSGAYYPFGIGTHLCLGSGAAEVQIVLVLASLLHMLRLEMVDASTSLSVKNDPTPTLGTRFRIRIAEQRHRVSF
jgi:cytochrome P450